jgi:hypothetical protein
MSDKQQDMPAWGLAAFSWIFAIYFTVLFHRCVGFPPEPPKTFGEATYLIVALFFLFLPFFKKIKIGKVLELEREIERTKTDLKGFKDITANTLSVLSTSINTVSNSNTVNVNIPSLEEMLAARQQLEDSTTPPPPGGPPGSGGPTPAEVEQVREEIVLEDEDTTMALARLRITMESLLRNIMRKRTATDVEERSDIKYLSLGRLFHSFVRRYPQYKDVEQSFRYVNQICNAAMHAQRVPQGQALEALQMGVRLVALFKDISESPE